MYHLEIDYEPVVTLDIAHSDRLIRDVVLPLGGKPAGSGFCQMTGTRDIEFSFDDEPDPIAITNALRPQIEGLCSVHLSEEVE